MDDAVNSVMANLADQPNPPKIGVLANAFPLMKKIMKGLMKASMYCAVTLRQKPMQILLSNGQHQVLRSLVAVAVFRQII